MRYAVVPTFHQVAHFYEGQPFGHKMVIGGQPQQAAFHEIQKLDYLPVRHSKAVEPIEQLGRDEMNVDGRNSVFCIKAVADLHLSLVS